MKKNKVVSFLIISVSFSTVAVKEIFGKRITAGNTILHRKIAGRVNDPPLQNRRFCTAKAGSTTHGGRQDYKRTPGTVFRSRR